MRAFSRNRQGIQVLSFIILILFLGSWALAKGPKLKPEELVALHLKALDEIEALLDVQVVEIIRKREEV